MTIHAQEIACRCPPVFVHKFTVSLLGREALFVARGYKARTRSQVTSTAKISPGRADIQLAPPPLPASHSFFNDSSLLPQHAFYIGLLHRRVALPVGFIALALACFAKPCNRYCILRFLVGQYSIWFVTRLPFTGSTPPVDIWG